MTAEDTTCDAVLFGRCQRESLDGDVAFLREGNEVFLSRWFFRFESLRKFSVFGGDDMRSFLTPCTFTRDGGARLGVGSPFCDVGSCAHNDGMCSAVIRYLFTGKSQ